MLIRVSGKLNDGRPFSTRVDAADVFEATTRAASSLKSAGVVATQIAARPLAGQSSVTIGKVREKSAKKAKK